MISLIIQILMQPKIWRFVSFASAVVGLLCYALSSCFIHLFGNWTFVKIFLYCVFSLIISLIILFAKKWKHWRNLQFKAHLAFLVLTITSLYSFISDKKMNAKPDAYSLISCAAFAIMSLSLSRQTQCGFEVDLMYFFLGFLMVQLMKIKLLLAIVGAGFSYSLIILRSTFPSALPDVDQYPTTQEEPSVVVLVDSPHLADISSIKQKLMTCLKELQQHDLNLGKLLLERVKEYLENNAELVVTDHQNFIIQELPQATINEFHETGKLMVDAGCEKEFSSVYCSWREEWLNKVLEDIHKIEDQKDEIGFGGWVKASNIALKILFPNERRLCNSIFFGLSLAADLSFMEVCRRSVVQLLNFADGVAIGSRSPERLFRVLDVFETLRDLIPMFESMFCDQYSVSLRNEAITIWKKLADAIRGIFMEFESLVRQDPAKGDMPGGELHPLTRYVMNYLLIACESQHTLEQVFEDYGGPKLDDKLPSSLSLSLQMDRIIEVLESNLEAKSKIYKDPALCYVFLMNNSMYIVQKTKDSELRTILGDNWIRKHNAKLRQYPILYQRSSWNKVLGFLKLDNGPVLPGGVAKSMKEKLRSFNMFFEVICRVQSSWFVFDEQLREDMIISLESILLPAYRNFIGRFQSVPELGKHADKYIKYGTEDIEAMLEDLFQGSRGSTGSR